MRLDGTKRDQEESKCGREINNEKASKERREKTILEANFQIRFAANAEVEERTTGLYVSTIKFPYNS